DRHANPQSVAIRRISFSDIRRHHLRRRASARLGFLPRQLLARSSGRRKLQPLSASFPHHHESLRFVSALPALRSRRNFSSRCAPCLLLRLSSHRKTRAPLPAPQKASRIIRDGRARLLAVPLCATEKRVLASEDASGNSFFPPLFRANSHCY